jgi:hypothetical protein
MNSAPDPKEAASQDASTGRPDERLAHAYEEIKRADEQLTRMSEQLAKIEGGAARPPSAGVPKEPAAALPSARAPSSSAEPPAKPAPAEPASAQAALAQPSSQIDSPPVSPARPVNRSPMALLLAACFVVAALIGSTYGGIVTRWGPQPVSKQSSPPEAPTLAAQSAPALVQVAAAENTSLPAAPQEAQSRAKSLVQAQPAPQEAAPPATTAPAATAPATAAPADQAALLQKIARDLATLERNIEQLKANQQQMAGENSKAIGELKASQEELKRTIAKVSPQPLPKVSAPAAPPVSVVRRPERTYQPPQARARPRYYPRDDWVYDDW